jgi:lipoate-protein ligase A
VIVPGSAGVSPASVSRGNGAGDCSAERLRERLTGREWRLIEDGAAPGAWNMAVDDALLEAARRNEAPPTLRLYRWSRPTLSLGRHQDPCRGIDHEFRRSRGIDLVRRPTGGRAVLHDDEVTYSIVLPAALGRGAGVGDVYCVLSGALLSGLTELLQKSGVQAFRRSGAQVAPGSAGVPDTAGEFGSAGRKSQAGALCGPHPQPLPRTQGRGGLARGTRGEFASRIVPARMAEAGGDARAPSDECLKPASCFATAAGGDGLVGAGKLVGSAQARRAGAVLQHGSVLLSLRRVHWDGLFGGRGLEIALGELVDLPHGEAAVRTALRRGLQCALESRLTPGTVTPAEHAVAERLRTERYRVGCLD